MTVPPSEEAAGRISREIYDRLRRRTLRTIGLTEKQIDNLHADVAKAIRRDLRGLIKHSDKEVERVLRKHYGQAFQRERQKIAAKQIERSATDGATAAEDTFNRIYGSAPPPLSGKSSSRPRRHLKLLPPPESVDR